MIFIRIISCNNQNINNYTLQPYEVNSKVRMEEYLQHIENGYKQDYLPQIVEQSEVMTYDWREFRDTMSIVEDLERLDFDKVMNDPYDPKFNDWKMNNSDNWAGMRYM